MASKVFAILFVLCVAQGLNAQLWSRPTGQGRPSFGQLGERFQQFASNLQGRFQNCIQNALNAFGQTQAIINNAAEQAVAQGASLDVAQECVKAQQGRLEGFAESLAQRIEEISGNIQGEIAAELGKDIVDAVQTEMGAMANTIRNGPKQVAQLIDEDKFLEAAKVFQATRDQVTVHTVNIMKELEPAREAAPEIVERAEELSKQFLQDAFKGAEGIKAEVQQCIANGGPVVA